MLVFDHLDAAEALLASAPRVRNRLVEVMADIAAGRPADVEAWNDVVSFLEKSERPDLELAHARELRSAHLRGAKVTVEDIQATMGYVDRAADEIAGLLVHRIGGELTPEWTDFGNELEKEFAPKKPAKRPNIVDAGKKLIYGTPGLYIAQIHAYLVKDGFDVSYPAVYDTVMALQASGDVITMGHHQGVRRFCFPHPAKLQNRSRYFGKLLAVRGRVEENLTDHFSPVATIAEALLVNHNMKAVIVLAPWGTKFGENDTLEGWGKFEKVSEISRWLKPRDEKVLKKVDGLVVPRELHTLGPDGKVIPLSREFLATFALNA